MLPRVCTVHTMAMEQLLQSVLDHASSISATEAMHLEDFDMERMRMDAAASIASSMDRVRGFSATDQCAFLAALRDVSHVFGNDANTRLVEGYCAGAERAAHSTREERCTLHK